MCGRFVSSTSRYDLAERFGVTGTVGDALAESYNVAPGRLVYAVAAGRRGRRLGNMHWGMVASWSPAPDRGPRPINARAENLTSSALFGPALDRRRCVVPADGFYEWRRGPVVRQPVLFSAPDGSVLAMAGLWARWRGTGAQDIMSCAVITTAASSVVSPCHHRMPALLDEQAMAEWLDPARTDGAALAALLGPAPDTALVGREVDPLVNNAANDCPELIRGTGVIA